VIPLPDAKRLALNPRLDRSVVVLRFDSPTVLDGKKPGSGVLLRSDPDVLVILTANHVVSDIAEYRQTVCSGGGFNDAYHYVARLPEADVAALLVRADIAPRLWDDALPLECVSTNSPVRAGLDVALVGFPEEMTTLHHVGPGMRWKREHKTAVYYSHRYGVEQDTIWVPWSRKMPIGISGAPLFLIDRADPIDTLPMLVGVATDFVRGREHASPCWAWNRWLHGVVRACRDDASRD